MSHTVHHRRRPRASGAPRRLDASPELQIHAAIPDGSTRAKSQPAALRAFEARIALEADLGRLRSDAERNALLIARAVVFSADWQTMVSRPGWDTLVDRTSKSRSTIAKYLKMFREWGLLGVVASGSTHRTRGHKRGDENGNLAGEYVLCVPADEPVEETRTPSLLRQEERRSACVVEVKPHVRARENKPWPSTVTPKRRGEQRQAAGRLREQEPILRQLTTKHLARLLRPWFERGWDLAQLRYALNHTPDGTHRWHSHDVRHVPGWIRHRLAAWDGHTPPRQLGAGQATDLTAADVAQLPRADAAPVADTETHAARARRMLAATQRRSDKKVARGLGVSLPGRDGQAPSTVCEAPVELGGGDGGWLLRNAAARARTTSDMPGRVVA